MIGLYQFKDHTGLRILCGKDMPIYTKNSLILIQEIGKYIFSNVTLIMPFIISEHILQTNTKIKFYNCLIHKGALKSVSFFYSGIVKFVDCEVVD